MPFIVLEGLDGAGKSTQTTKLKKMLTDLGKQVEYIHFPRYDTPIYGELVAKFLRGELGDVDGVSPYLVALIFAGDRAQIGSQIGEWIEEGRYVIVDRYVYSNVAFQCAKIECEKERSELERWIMELEFGLNKLPRPDLSLFLDVPLGFVESSLTKQREGEDRDYLDGGRDIHEESMELQKNVRKTYLECADRYRDIEVVECGDAGGRMKSPEAIFEQIEGRVKRLIG